MLYQNKSLSESSFERLLFVVGGDRTVDTRVFRLSEASIFYNPLIFACKLRANQKNKALTGILQGLVITKWELRDYLRDPVLGGPYKQTRKPALHYVTLSGFFVFSSLEHGWSC